MVEKVSHIHLDQTDSTNTYAKENYQQFDLKGITRISANEQTHGRGRFNREWLSPKGESLCVSYFFTVDKDTADINNLSQVVSLSIAKLLDQKGLSPEIKWPNDILIKGKKIAGILCELIDLKESFGVILGIGLNVNLSQKTCAGIDQPATSLFIETGEKHDLPPLMEVLEAFFLKDFSLYKQEGFKPFYMSYDALLTHKGKEITLQQEGKIVSGVLHSLNPDGRLNVLLPNGDLQTLSSGEIKK